MRVPSNPLGRVVEAASHGPESLLRAAGLLPRVVHLLESAEQLLARVTALVGSIETTEADVRVVVGRVADSERAAAQVVAAAARSEQRVADLLDVFEPLLVESVDTISYASARFGRAQVDALVGYLDFLSLLKAFEADVVPIMRTLNTVAPDLSELVAVSRAANELMGSLPGLGRAKKRVDEELAQQQVEQA